MVRQPPRTPHPNILHPPTQLSPGARTRARAHAHTLLLCCCLGAAGPSRPLAEPLWAVPVRAAPWRCPRACTEAAVTSLGWKPQSRARLGPGGRWGRESSWAGCPRCLASPAPAGQVHGREPATLTFPFSGTGPADAAGGCGFIKSSSFLAPSQPQHTDSASRPGGTSPLRTRVWTARSSAPAGSAVKVPSRRLA